MPHAGYKYVHRGFTTLNLQKRTSILLKSKQPIIMCIFLLHEFTLNWSM